jgi:hypothetical protein
MPKGQSSASKGTRKKQEAKRKQAKGDPLPQTSTKKTKRNKNAHDETKRKQYIAPSKPKGVVDPVDLHGLALSSSLLNPQTVVTLRLLNKRDEKTLFRALEEYDAWIRSADVEGEVLATLPVWIFHFNKLASHSSRRIRALTASIHALLVSPKNEDARSILLSPSELLNPQFSGSWLCLAHDADRGIRHIALGAWSSSLNTTDSTAEGINLAELAPELVPYLFSMLETASSPAAASEPTSGDESNPNIGMTDMSPVTKADTADEDNQSRSARLLSSAVDALTYLFKSLPDQRTELFESIIDSEKLWGLLYCTSKEDVSAVSAVRRAAWSFLSALLGSQMELEKDVLQVIARPALYGAFSEDSALVQSNLWQPFLTLIRCTFETSEFPQSDASFSSA